MEKLRSAEAYGGLDLAAVSDLTAFVLAWPVDDQVYVYPWFWIPEDDIAMRSKRDNVPYVDWVEKGLVETTPGNVTDWRFVTERIKQLAHIFDIQQIGFDPAGARDTARDLQDDGIEVVDTRQGFMSLSPPAKRLEGLVLSGQLVHNGHPVLRWNVDCCAIQSDPAGNIKPVKPDRQRSTKRIDGVVAMTMAIDCIMRAESNYITSTAVRSIS